MSRHFPILIIVIPLLMAVIIPIVARCKGYLSTSLATLALSISLAFSLLLLPEVLVVGRVSYYLGSWEPPFGIEVKIDFLGLFMIILVAAASLATAIYSRNYVPHEIEQDKNSTYYSLYLLFSASMLGFSATGDIFNMFVFLEIMSVASYALVAIPGTSRAIRAAFKYLLMGAPSSMLVLLAISFLYSVTGTLNMGDLTEKIAASSYPRIVTIAYGIFIIGFAVKAALFPLHMWLPDAHSIAPSPISAQLSGLFVNMGVLGVIRLTYSIYTVYFSPDINAICSALSWVAAAAVIYGSIMAIRQKDLKMMIAYSTVAHIGYIFLGVGLMNVMALTGGIYHILNHCLSKSCLFLCAGSFIYQSGYRKITELKGASRRMPITSAAFALASLSLVGIPPTTGFISKWYLIGGSLHADNILFAVVIIIGSLLAAVYCFRVVYYMFFLPPVGGAWEGRGGEAPAAMVGASWAFALATLAFGIFAYWLLPPLERAVAALIYNT